MPDCVEMFAFSNKFDLLDVMNTIVTSWSEITAKTIPNCFSHAGFVSRDGGGGDEDLFDEEHKILLAQQSLDDTSAQNGLETAPPIDENLIINKQRGILQKPEQKPVISHAEFMLHLVDMKDYLCLQII